MPWYWSDNIARDLLSLGKVDKPSVARLISCPVAYRIDCDTMAQAGEWLMEEDEIPLAA